MIAAGMGHASVIVSLLESEPDTEIKIDFQTKVHAWSHSLACTYSLTCVYTD